MFDREEYLFYKIVKPMAIWSTEGCRTAMNNTNTVEQPYESFDI